MTRWRPRPSRDYAGPPSISASSGSGPRGTGWSIWRWWCADDIGVLAELRGGRQRAAGVRRPLVGRRALRHPARRRRLGANHESAEHAAPRRRAAGLRYRRTRHAPSRLGDGAGQRPSTLARASDLAPSMRSWLRRAAVTGPVASIRPAPCSAAPWPASRSGMFSPRRRAQRCPDLPDFGSGQRFPDACSPLRPAGSAFRLDAGAGWVGSPSCPRRTPARCWAFGPAAAGTRRGCPRPYLAALRLVATPCGEHPGLHLGGAQPAGAPCVRSRLPLRARHADCRGELATRAGPVDSRPADRVRGAVLRCSRVLLSLLSRLRWWPVASAAAWVLVEYAYGRVPFGGFGWIRLAYAAVDTPLSGFLPVIGVAGLSFVVAPADPGHRLVRLRDLVDAGGTCRPATRQAKVRAPGDGADRDPGRSIGPAVLPGGAAVRQRPGR